MSTSKAQYVAKLLSIAGNQAMKGKISLSIADELQNFLWEYAASTGITDEVSSYMDEIILMETEEDAVSSPLMKEEHMADGKYWVEIEG